MIYLQFFLGLLAYTGLAFLSYSPILKASSYYYAMGVVGALLANGAWMWIAKTTSNPSELVVKGIYWDVMLMAAFLSVPFLYGAKLTGLQVAGIGTIIAGLFMMKAGELFGG